MHSHQDFFNVIHRHYDEPGSGADLPYPLHFFIITDRKNAGGMRCQHQKKLNY